jgi:alpha-glucosidase
MVILDPANPSVLSYARVSAAGEAVIVSLNMSAQPQTVSLGLAQAGLHGARLRTLLTDAGAPAEGAAADRHTLAPFASWVAEVH